MGRGRGLHLSQEVVPEERPLALYKVSALGDVQGMPDPLVSWC